MFLSAWTLACTILCNQPALAKFENPALLTYIKGEVQIFESGAKKNEPGTVLFEGSLYKSHKAKLGEKLFSGALVHTGSDGKARIAYPNGDQINVAPGTAVKVDREDAQDGTAQSELDVKYGKVRAFASKRKVGAVQFKVRTPGAVAGVRGTDFTVGYNPSGNESEVSVLRGEVVVQDDKKTQSVPVKAGDALKVEVPPAVKTTATTTTTKQDIAKPKFEVKKISQQEVKQIADFSEGKLSAEEKKQIDVKTVEAIEKIETTVVEKKIAALKVEDPKLYEKINSTGAKSIEDVDSAMMGKILETAPNVPTGKEETKKIKEAVEKLKDEDVYKK